MFNMKKEAKDIKQQAYETGMNACKFHANVRHSIVLFYRSEGINPTNELVNELADQINKDVFNQRFHNSVNKEINNRIWAM